MSKTEQTTLRVAAAQYDISHQDSQSSFEQKLEHWVEEAIGEGAELLLFPEYAAMELVSLLSGDLHQDLDAQIEAMQELLPWYQSCYRTLAREHDVTIVAGSFPVRVDNTFHNRAFVFSRDGDVGYQDKQKMTRFENESWHISAGNSLTLFHCKGATFGICLCYDVEFPVLAREFIRQGAHILLVPSCTDGIAGFNRVQISCRARALENQCYVIQSVTVGEAPWSLAVDVNIGTAGMFSPVDRGFPDDGILASGRLNQPQWVYADLDLSAINTVRAEGQVFNYADWGDLYI